MQLHFEVVNLLYVLVYVCLIFFFRNTAVFGSGFLFMSQCFGLNRFVYHFIKHGWSQAIRAGILFVVLPFVLAYLTKGVDFTFREKNYSGLRLYLLLVDTALKYIVGLFMISFLINLYLGLTLQFTVITLVITFIASILIISKINRDTPKSIKKKELC